MSGKGGGGIHPQDGLHFPQAFNCSSCWQTPNSLNCPFLGLVSLIKLAHPTLHPLLHLLSWLQLEFQVMCLGVLTATHRRVVERTSSQKAWYF